MASAKTKHVQVLRPQSNLIAGQWHAPAVSSGQQICNSNTGEVLAQRLDSTADQVDSAIKAAYKAHRRRSWSQRTREQRAETLCAIGTALDDVIAEIALADALTTGVPIATTRILAHVCGAAFRVAAQLVLDDDAERNEADYMLERLPLGAAAIIAPWNAPAGIACHKLASALAAGCPVVFKPSEWAPHSAQIIAEVIESANLPVGVFNMLHGGGETGSQIVADERIAAVSLTGGLSSGRAVAAACAVQCKPAQLELGGNNPLIVLPDAEVDAAADGVVTALTTLNGQWCRALGRLLVHESLASELHDAIMERLSAIRIGASTDESVDMGPLAHEPHLQHTAAAIDNYIQMGGTVHTNSRLPDLPGWFIAPTLVSDIAPIHTQHEIFGPVATVHEFSDVDEAVAIANQAPYGLAAYVYGGRENAIAASRRLETGMVKVNSVTLFSPHPSLPRAAWKLSGLGEEGSLESFEFFRGTRVIGFPPAGGALNDPRSIVPKSV